MPINGPVCALCRIPQRWLRRYQLQQIRRVIIKQLRIPNVAEQGDVRLMAGLRFDLVKRLMFFGRTGRQARPQRMAGVERGIEPGT